MPMDIPIFQTNPTPLQPFYAAGNFPAQTIAVNIGPNLTLAKGTVMAQVTAGANDVQTVSMAGPPTAGTFNLQGVNPATGSAWAVNGLAYNASSATIQAALRATNLGTGVTATGGPLPGTPVVITFSGTLGNLPIGLITTTGSALTGGTVAVAHTTQGQTPGTFAAYVNGGAGGLGTARGILQYDVATDGQGYIYFAPAVPTVPLFAPDKTAPIWVSGAFLNADCVGLDAGALTNLGARQLTPTCFVF
jgi:hypothetical protein